MLSSLAFGASSDPLPRQEDEEEAPPPCEALAAEALDQFLWTSHVLTFECKRIVGVPQRGERMPARQYRSGTVRLAECEVRDGLYGPLEVGAVFFALVPTSPDWKYETEKLESGVGLAGFGPEDTLWVWASEETREDVLEAVGDAPVLSFQGVVHVFPDGKLATVLPHDPEHVRPYLFRAPKLPDCVEAVRRRIARLVPTVEVHYATTGPSPWRATILEGDALHVHPAHGAPEVTREIPPQDLARIRERIAELVAELPERDFGRSRHPDQSFLWVAVYGEHERRVYRIYAYRDDEKVPAGLEKLVELAAFSGLLELDLHGLEILRSVREERR